MKVADEVRIQGDGSAELVPVLLEAVRHDWCTAGQGACFVVPIAVVRTKGRLMPSVVFVVLIVVLILIINGAF